MVIECYNGIYYLSQYAQIDIILTRIDDDSETDASCAVKAGFMSEFIRSNVVMTLSQFHRPADFDDIYDPKSHFIVSS